MKGKNMTLKEMIDAGRDLLTRREAAELLLLKPNTLAVWATKGWYSKELPVVKLSRTVVRYRRADIERFIANRAGKTLAEMPVCPTDTVRAEGGGCAVVA